MAEGFDMDGFLENPKETIAPGVEIAAEMMIAVRKIFELFVALQRAGFNESQALFVVSEAMKNGSSE